MTSVDVTCAGIAVCDVVVRTVHHPLPLGLLQLVDDLTLVEGGCALRTAKALAGMGVDTTLIAPIGADLFGKVLRRSADSDRLEAQWVEVDANTSSSAILVDTAGERTIFHQIGANRFLTAEHVRRRMKGRFLHVGGALVLPALDGEPLAQLFAHAKQNGMQTSLDVVYNATNEWDLVNAALAHTDLFCPSLAEAQAITGKSSPDAGAAELRRRGVRLAVITDGVNGCWFDCDETRGHIAAIEVDSVDSTGAGDAFTAGVLIGLLRGLPSPQAVRLGAALGALAATTSVTFAGLNDPDEAWRMAGLEVPRR
ncbi:putative sugar kinase YdjH [bacterium BMS3Abin02]|nr:putative sugar kinase YdjH [bacterium BMS3Abin02]GBE22559.1 putative sugar kinase YdjH [bacterium BMS3Bbin01]HDL49130.1 carbohydrate kinase family protein [Actinomycetota bacterium]